MVSLVTTKQILISHVLNFNWLQINANIIRVGVQLPVNCAYMQSYRLGEIHWLDRHLNQMYSLIQKRLPRQITEIGCLLHVLDLLVLQKKYQRAGRKMQYVWQCLCVFFQLYPEPRQFLRQPLPGQDFPHKQITHHLQGP